MKLYLILAALVLTSCGPKPAPQTVTIDRIVEVKIPVTIPCMGQKPEEIVSLNLTLDRAQWDALSTEEREQLLVDRHLQRKVFGEQLEAATAGCAQAVRSPDA